MATWTVEQANGGNGDTLGTPPQLAFPSNVKAGSLLIAVCGGDDTTSPVNTPTDTRGNTWTLIRNQDDATNGVRAVWWYAIANGAGADTVTFTNMGAFDFYQILEVSVDSGTIGIDTSGGTPIQNGQAANHTNAANNISSGSVTPSGNDAFILGFAAEDGANNTYSAGTNYSLISAANTNLAGIAQAPVRLEQRTLATPSAVSATFTGNASGRAIAMVAVFRATGGGGTEQFIAAAVDLSPTIDVALTREQLFAAASDLSPDIAVALVREQFLASADAIDPSVVVSLVQEMFIAAALDLSPAVATSLTREQFVAAALDISPAIAAALTREVLLSALMDVSPAIAVDLSREALIAAVLDISPSISVSLTGGTGVTLHNLLTLGVG